MTVIYDGGYRGDCTTERGEHISCIAWLELNHPGRWPLIFHVANEARGSVQHYDIRKRMGVKAGVSDIIDFGSVRGAFELKRKDRTKSKVSREQLNFLEAVSASGGFSAICYGYEQFVIAYSDYLEYCAGHGVK